LSNGDLLDAAENAGFDVLLTTDKNLRHQQNLQSRKLAIVVSQQKQVELGESMMEQIVVAVNAAKQESYALVDIPYADSSKTFRANAASANLGRPSIGVDPASCRETRFSSLALRS